LINDRLSVWAATETDDPVKIYDRIPFALPMNKATTSQRGAIGTLWLEMNTSSDDVNQGRANGLDGIFGTADDWTDLITYVRNLAVLKDVATLDPTNDASWSALRVKPVR
jgi:hypothetical protein